MTSQLVANIQGRLPSYGEFAPGSPNQPSPRGHNGDCVEYALMVARAAAQTWQPCDGVELDRLTNLSIGAGEAGPAGQMTNANLAWLCASESIPYQQVTTGDLLALAQSYAGRLPLCMGFSNGQALPGNEQGVFGHCVAVLDWDGSHFTLANGDSTNGEAGRLDTASRSDLQNAQPTQVTLLELSMSTPYDSYFTITNAGYTLKSDPNITLSGGELALWQSVNGAPGLPLGGMNYRLQGEVGASHLGYRLYERAIVVWDPAHALDSPPQQDASKQFYLAHVSDPRFALYPVPPAPPAPSGPSDQVDGVAVTLPHTITITEH